MSENQKEIHGVPKHVTDNVPNMDSGDLLEEFERWTNLCHYDPHGQAKEFNPFVVTEYLRKEVLHRMENMPSTADED